jgi:hypothetical protein
MANMDDLNNKPVCLDIHMHIYVLGYTYVHYHMNSGLMYMKQNEGTL